MTFLQDTSAVKRTPPPPALSDDGHSDEEEWHDAPDTPETDVDAIGASSSSPSPLDAAKREHALKEVLEDANNLKTRGNDLFRESNWQRALEVYLEGLNALPSKPPSAKDKGKRRATESDEESDDISELAPKPGSMSIDHEPTAQDLSPLTLMEQQCSVLRSILNSNIAACHAKLGDHKTAITFCDQSLLDVPTYGKALHRRAASNEALGTWSSLSAAQTDYQTLVDTLPSNSPLRPSSRRALESLPSRVQKAQKAETDEMLDKLKGLGNSVLGRFGMSTDNFKFTPNGQGGYSMNFVQ